MSLSQREPIALGALVQIGVNAILSALVAFHVVTLDGDQTAAVYGVVNAVCAIVVAVKTRQVTFSPADVNANYTPVIADVAPCGTVHPDA